MPLVVLDWDGTVTEVDGLHMVLERFGDVGVYDAAENRLGRELTLHEVIALEFSTVRAPIADVVEWLLGNVRLRAGFAEFARRRSPLIVSSGFHELIEPVLAREGLELDLRANRLEPMPEGWRAIFRSRAVCPVCGQPCKRADLDGVDPFVYVGDGFSDRCVSEAAARVFARDGLAAYLDSRSVPYEPFTDFHDLETQLRREAA